MLPLHIFSDALDIGNSSVRYLSCNYPERVEVMFLMARCRVAPLKLVTIPRLELCAALIGTRLATFLVKEIGFEISEIVFWTDSTTVLKWIHSTHYRFHTYGGNHVGEILETTQPPQWCYVATQKNPANDCSRVLSTDQLSNDHRWFNGRPFWSYQRSNGHWLASCIWLKNTRKWTVNALATRRYSLLVLSIAY